MGSDDDLLNSLRIKGIKDWKDVTDAIPFRINKALIAAIQSSKPKAHRIALPTATIEDEAQLDAWLKVTKTAVHGKLQDGPVILGG